MCSEKNSPQKKETLLFFCRAIWKIHHCPALSAALSLSRSLWTVINHKSGEHLSQWAACPFIAPGLSLSLLQPPRSFHSSQKKLCCEFVTAGATTRRSPCPWVGWSCVVALTLKWSSACPTHREEEKVAGRKSFRCHGGEI